MEEISSDTPAPPARDAPREAPRGRKLLAWLVVGYGVAVVTLWAWMYRWGDREWLATLVLFGPRWICSLPLPLLALAAAVFNRRLLWPLAATLLVIVGPLMGFRAHLPARGARRPDLRVLTCNVNKDAIRTTSLAALIDASQPDVVALQEVKVGTRFVWPPGWHVVEHDEFILASRFPLVERGHAPRPAHPFEIAALRFAVQMPDREIEVVNLHLESPRPGIEAVLNFRTGIDLSQVPRLEGVLKLRATESERTSRWIASAAGPKIVMGDFNMPLESAIFRRDWSEYSDAFSTVGWGFGFTKVSEKRGWSYGARIDHVLFSPPWRCVRSWVAADIGSDHLPLIADFDFE